LQSSQQWLRRVQHSGLQHCVLQRLGARFSSFFWLAYSLTLEKESVCSSETPSFLRITWCYNPENHILQVKRSFCINAAFLLERNYYKKTNDCEFSIVTKSFSILTQHSVTSTWEVCMTSVGMLWLFRFHTNQLIHSKVHTHTHTHTCASIHTQQDVSFYKSVLPSST
jgi:hypothetical protein